MLSTASVALQGRHDCGVPSRLSHSRPSAPSDCARHPRSLCGRFHGLEAAGPRVQQPSRARRLQGKQCCARSCCAPLVTLFRAGHARSWGAELSQLIFFPLCCAVGRCCSSPPRSCQHLASCRAPWTVCIGVACWLEWSLTRHTVSVSGAMVRCPSQNPQGRLPWPAGYDKTATGGSRHLHPLFSLICLFLQTSARTTLASPCSSSASLQCRCWR